jgi:hypothetical protein
MFKLNEKFFEVLWSTFSLISLYSSIVHCDFLKRYYGNFLEVYPFPDHHVRNVRVFVPNKWKQIQWSEVDVN